MSDQYVVFLESVSAKLEDAVASFTCGESSDGAEALEQALVLCEVHPAFALCRGTNIGSMRDVLEACIRDAMHRRPGVGASLAALLQRVQTLAQTELH